MPFDLLFVQLLERVVDRKLLARAARADGLEKDEEVRRRMAFSAEGVLQDVYLGRKLDGQLTEARLRAAYDRMVAERGEEVEVRARHILLESREDATEVIADLRSGGDFEALAKERSTGPSAENGGDLGYFTRDRMVAEFSDAAFALKPGAYTSEPVQTQFGWHVIRVEDRREAAPPSYEESVDELRRQEAGVAIGEIITSLRDSADVRLFSPDGSEIKPGENPGKGRN